MRPPSVWPKKFTIHRPRICRHRAGGYRCSSPTSSVVRRTSWRCERSEMCFECALLCSTSISSMGAAHQIASKHKRVWRQKTKLGRVHQASLFLAGWRRCSSRRRVRSRRRGRVDMSRSYREKSCPVYRSRFHFFLYFVIDGFFYLCENSKILNWPVGTDMHNLVSKTRDFLGVPWEELQSGRG